MNTSIHIYRQSRVYQMIIDFLSILKSEMFYYELLLISSHFKTSMLTLTYLDRWMTLRTVSTVMQMVQRSQRCLVVISSS